MVPSGCCIYCGQQCIIQKSAIPKTIRREIDLFEDEGFRRTYFGENHLNSLVIILYHGTISVSD
ncbi:UNVERIFIED_CONTAM: hypothetical protein NCL1_38839 [Trichonephila clavipes]